MATRTGNPRSALDVGRKRLLASLRGMSLDDLSKKIVPELADLLSAAAVRLYFPDPLSGELCASFLQNKKTRELRVAPEPSSAVGYAAMTLKTSFAWKREDDTRKLYVVAVPVLAGGELAAVMEWVHGAPNVPADEDRLRVLREVAENVGRRMEELSGGTTTRSPYDGLLRAGKLTRDALKKARDEASAAGASLEQVLMTRYGVDKGALGKSLADHFGVPFVASPANADSELLRRFAPDFLKARSVLPVRWKGDRAEIVVMNPGNLTLVDDLCRLLGTDKLTLMVAVKEDIGGALDRLLKDAAPPPAASSSDAPPEWEKGPAEAGGFDLGGGTVDSKTIQLVNETIQDAMDKGASDIHLETTQTGGMTIRFRVDGVCHEHRTVREACSRAVISRLKIMSELNITEHRLPQDGKIRLKDKGGRRMDLRVAIMPTFGGHEDAVLRLLPEYQVLTLDQIAMEPDVLERFRKVIGQPHGMVLCVGPTGSGKTTTLHAALAAVKGPEVKVWTAEDPVEITQEGVRQVQMQAQIGLTFDRALRAFLRCDPDVIMIGEIRDRETAGAAIEASLTGHLVFSTLHTNSAAETVTRLLDLGLDPFSFANSLLGVLAQRLVRTLCKSCAQKGPATAEEIEELRGHYGEGWDALRIDRRRLQLARPAGCAECFQTGYKGRIGVHELLVMSPGLRRLIQQKAQADEIAAEARSGGMFTLRQDGIRKALRGHTDLKEVLSNTRAD
jgi:type II secretory ATPase GspE/PulE/Tfp pilus assembly ATPase PilB-like protein